jgi:hypothetical protein
MIHYHVIMIGLSCYHVIMITCYHIFFPENFGTKLGQNVIGIFIYHLLLDLTSVHTLHVQHKPV